MFSQQAEMDVRSQMQQEKYVSTHLEMIQTGLKTEMTSPRDTAISSLEKTKNDQEHPVEDHRDDRDRNQTDLEPEMTMAGKQASSTPPPYPRPKMVTQYPQWAAGSPPTHNQKKKYLIFSYPNLY